MTRPQWLFGEGGRLRGLGVVEPEAHDAEYEDEQEALAEEFRTFPIETVETMTHVYHHHVVELSERALVAVEFVSCCAVVIAALTVVALWLSH